MTALAPLAVLLCLPACGKNGESADYGPTPTLPPVVLEDEEGAVTIALMAGLGDVQRGRATFDWDVQRDGFHISGDGEMLFDTDRLNLDEHYKGEGDVPSKFAEENATELRLIDNLVYVKTPAFGDSWTSFDASQLGVEDWSAVFRLLEARSPLNLLTLASEPLTAVEYKDYEEIDGEYFLRFTFLADANTVMKALADAYGAQGQLMFVDRFAGQIPVELWTDGSLLPRRVRANGTFSYLGEDTTMNVSVDLTQLNEIVELPGVPEGAEPFYY